MCLPSATSCRNASTICSIRNSPHPRGATVGLGGCGPSQHLLANHQIQVSGDAARSLTRARVFHQGAGERADRTYECFGEYHDTWIRTPDGWRMRTRRFDVSMALGDIDVLQPG